MPWSMRFLRAFLGVTFVFAGAQKLLDGSFLHRGSPDFIGTQLAGFAHGDPVSAIMAVLAKAPLVVGIAVALTEIAIGAAVLLGIGMLTAAAVGFLINLTLFLSATWHVHPYFLGSDSIYAVTWLVFAAGIWEVRRSLEHGYSPLASLSGYGRREFLRGGVVAGVAVVVAGAAKAFAGAPITGSKGITAAASKAGTHPAPKDVSPSAPTSTAPPAPKGHVITTLSQLPVGKAIGFAAPGVGAAVLLRLANDSVVAYSRTCTHAGCTVGYDPGARILVCPCHGAEFDPANGAQPIAGPTNTPLQSIKVIVDAATGKVILPQ
ncbi:MAG: thiosulfate dehydrogenase (quinone) large subunit [Actinomycetota bacterium]|nr:thiosulfate dehydrogenase (quinone) large subunit [Actinomycetota bacterium]